jgi:hypothetical protein
MYSKIWHAWCDSVGHVRRMVRACMKKGMVRDA